MRAVADDKTRAFNLDYALISAGWEPADVTLGDIDWLRLRLITQLVDRDRLDDAKPIIDKVLSPVVLVRMAIDRRFEAIWPQLEARLGPSADTADAKYLAATKARFDKNPKSLIARLGYAEALNIASREPEAIAIADVAKTPAELAALSNREIWLVNLHATSAGRRRQHRGVAGADGGLERHANRRPPGDGRHHRQRGRAGAIARPGPDRARSRQCRRIEGRQPQRIWPAGARLGAHLRAGTTRPQGRSRSRRRRADRQARCQRRRHAPGHALPRPHRCRRRRRHPPASATPTSAWKCCSTCNPS